MTSGVSFPEAPRSPRGAADVTGTIGFRFSRPAAIYRPGGAGESALRFRLAGMCSIVGIKARASRRAGPAVFRPHQMQTVRPEEFTMSGGARLFQYRRWTFMTRFKA